MLILNKSKNGWLLLRWLLLTFSLCKTPLGETGCLGNPYFTHWLPEHPVFWFTLTQSVRLLMVTYPSLCSPCVTYETLCHAIGHEVLPTQHLPREAEDFPRDDRYFKHVPPLTYLISLSPKELYMAGLFKPYSYSDSWRICSSWDLNSFHAKLSVLKVLYFIRLATEFYGQR